MTLEEKKQLAGCINQLYEMIVSGEKQSAQIDEVVGVAMKIIDRIPVEENDNS